MYVEHEQTPDWFSVYEGDGEDARLVETGYPTCARAEADIPRLLGDREG